MDDFIKNKRLWAKQHGYFQRVAAAINASSYLGAIAKSQKNIKLAQFYKAEMKKCESERKHLLINKKW